MVASLHGHSEFSTYDGYGKPEHRALYAAEIGLSALALTDHGTMAGSIRHYHGCKLAGIKAIIGCEGYFQPIFDRTKPRYHMTLLCENNQGYANLCQMLSLAAEETFFRYPILTLDHLKQFNQGIIMLSGCVQGYLSQALIRNQSRLASIAAQKFLDIFEDRFFLEVQPFECRDDMQFLANAGLIEIGHKLSIPLAMTNDSHFTKPEEYSTHTIMMRLGTRDASKGKEGEQDTTYLNRHISSEAEMLQAWESLMDFPGHEYLATTDDIAGRCNVELDFTEEIPSLNWGMDSKKKIIQLCRDGMKRIGKYEKPEYRQRLNYELNIIARKGFIDYFLLCADIYEYARQHGILPNFGRGSVCGSLLAYCLGITGIDPLIDAIPFETFLREDKATIPDIDMDFPRSRRQEIVNYLLQKYQGQAAQISTYGYYRVKNLANDLAKYLQMPEDALASFKKHLTRFFEDSEETDSTSEDLYGELNAIPELREINDRYNFILLHFARLYGQVRFVGKHAAGIAICSEDIARRVQLIHTLKGLQTAYDLTDLASVGIVKFDILGLATLDVVSHTHELIGHDYKLYDVLGDENVLEDFREGNLTGVFQFDSRAAQGIAKEIETETPLEVCIATSLNRPGPLRYDMPALYATAKYASSQGADVGVIPGIAEDTYGLLLFQDHIVQISRYAGLTPQEADSFVKAISKKNIGKYAGLRDKFYAGMQVKGHSQKEIDKLYEAMTLYGFKKAHAICYGYFAYYTAYLKHYHPLEYYASLLAYEEREEKRYEYENDAINKGYGIKIASINSSYGYRVFVDPEGDFWIERGLISIPNVGIAAARHLVEMRGEKPYESLGDIRARCKKSIINAKVERALIAANALVFREEDIKRLSVAYCKQVPYLLRKAKYKAGKFF